MISLHWTTHAMQRLTQRYGIDANRSMRETIEARMASGGIEVTKTPGRSGVVVSVYVLGSEVRLVLNDQLDRVITVLDSPRSREQRAQGYLFTREEITRGDRRPLKKRQRSFRRDCA